MGKRTVALRERGRVAALIHTLWHAARQQAGWREPDRRNTCTWLALLLAVVVARSTRLVALGQVMLAGGGRVAQTTKAVAVGLGHWLGRARCATRPAGTRLLSQNRVEEAVLFQALALLKRVALAAIVVGDRGLGRKELLVKLAQRVQAYVFRIDPDSTAYTPAAPDGRMLVPLLAAQPWLGEVVWDRGQEGLLPCRARAVRATIRFSRTERQADYEEATLHFLAVPGTRPTRRLH